MHQNARLPLFSPQGREPSTSDDALRSMPSHQQQTHIPLPGFSQSRSTHLPAYGTIEVRPTMTRVPAHRPTHTSTPPALRYLQETRDGHLAQQVPKPVLRTLYMPINLGPPLASLQRDQNPPSKTDAATNPILRLQRARTCAPPSPQPLPDSDRFGAITA